MLFQKWNFYMNKTFCTYPWTSLTFLPGNKTKVCGANRDVEYDPALDRKNTENLKIARKKMIDGDQVDGCEFCYEREKNEYWNTKRKESLRIWGKWQDEFISQTKEDGTTDFEPFYIDYREDDVEKLRKVIASLPRIRVLKLYKINFMQDWSTAFNELKNKMGHFYCCGETDKIRFDKEFLNVQSRSRRVSVIHNLKNNSNSETIEKVKEIQSILNGAEDEVQLYINVKGTITEDFLESFTKFDREFPDIKLRIYASDVLKQRGDPIEYYNKEIGIIKQMRNIAEKTNNQDLQALYRQFT